ncbi:MAG TPA: hypothetical protein VFM70_02975 [Salinimicrobium sp.]|nr:hypothetical protein [Salinimicrobium sp.]
MKPIKFLIALTTISLLISCEYEEDVETNMSGVSLEEYSVTNMNGKQIQMNAALVEKLRLFRNTPMLTGKIGDTISVSIDTTFAKYVESKDGLYHSYTFSSLNDRYKNILFSQKRDGTYGTFLVEYNLTPEQKKSLLLGEEIFFTNEVKTTAIEFTGGNLEMAVKMSACIDVAWTFTPGEPCVAGFYFGDPRCTHTSGPDAPTPGQMVMTVTNNWWRWKRQFWLIT